MPKRWRDAFKSFYESHIDPGKDEKLKVTKAEIESNVQMMLHVLKGKADNDDKELLINLIENFQNHYRSLYERYDNLTEQLREKANSKHGKDCSSSSLDSSDSDDEVANLKKALANSNLEKEALHKELESAFKLQEEQNQKLESYKTHKEEARGKMEAAEKEITKVNQMHEAAKVENTSLSLKISQLEDEIKHAKNKIQCHTAESSQLRERLAEKVRELSSNLEIHEAHKKEQKQKLESASEEIVKLTQMQMASEDENATLYFQISQLEEKIRQAENKIQDFDTESSRLNEKLVEKERELSNHLEIHESHKEQASIRVRDLEMELDSSQTQRRDIEKQKNDELSALLRKHEDQEKDSLTQINDLKEQINNVQAEAESLRNHKVELEAQLAQKGIETSAPVKDLTDQVHAKQMELESLLSQKRESETQLEKKDKEISEFLIQLKNLKDGESESFARITALTADINSLQEQLGSLGAQKNEAYNILDTKTSEILELQIQIEMFKKELSVKIADGKRLLEEKENLAVQQKDLQLELETLRHQQGELEDQISSKLNEGNQLREEKGVLESKISELEKALAERSDEVIANQEKLEQVQNETSLEIASWKTMVDSVHEQLGLLQSEKGQLGLEIERSKQVLSETLAQAENIKIELENKIMEQEIKLEEQANAFIILSAEHKQLEVQFHDCEENLKSSERKIEEMTQQFQNDINAKNEELNQLKENAESLKRDLEMKANQVSSLLVSMLNAEVAQRSIIQKLSVTEQSLREKDESYLRKEEKLQEKQKLLEEKVATFSGIIAAYKEAQVTMQTGVNKSLTDINEFQEKCEEDNWRLQCRVLEIVHNVKVTTNRITESNLEKDRLSGEIDRLVEQVNYERNRKLIFEELSDKLETDLQKEEDETSRLTETLRDKEEKMEEEKKKAEGLKEEKKEAIRQLCIAMDYYRTYIDQLRNMLAKTRR